MTQAPANMSAREALLACAPRLFATKGFDGVSVKELADAAHVNVSLVSYHFGGKEGLYLCCLEQFGKERMAAAKRMLVPSRSAEDFESKLRMFAQEIISCHVEQPFITQMIHLECDMNLPLAEGVFKSTFMQIHQGLEDFVGQAQRDRILAADLDPRGVTEVFFGSLIHLARSDRMAKRFRGVSIHEPKYQAKAIDTIVQIFLRGTLRKGNI